MTIYTAVLGKYVGSIKHIRGEEFLYWMRAKLADGRVLGPWVPVPSIVGLPTVLRSGKIAVMALVYTQNDLPAGPPARSDSNAVWYKQI